MNVIIICMLLMC